MLTNLGWETDHHVWTERAAAAAPACSECSSIRYHSNFFVQVGLITTYSAIGNHNIFTKTYVNYVLALQRSLIILVGLTMTWNSEKMMISYNCIRGFMPNSHKKSWMVSKQYVLSSKKLEWNTIDWLYYRTHCHIPIQNSPKLLLALFIHSFTKVMPNPC